MTARPRTPLRVLLAGVVAAVAAVVCGLPATAAAAPPVVDHCGELTGSQTWAAGPIHTVSCTVTVPVGTSLTIAPGAVVKFADDTELQVAGSLTVGGRGARPSQLTGLRDDSVGGDTNGDGDATTPARGDWRGIDVLVHAHVRITYATVAYAFVVYVASRDVIVAHTRFVRDEIPVFLEDGLTLNPRRVLVDNHAVDCDGDTVYAADPFWPDGASLSGGARLDGPEPWGYVVEGQAYIAAGATVTAPAGTHIKFREDEFTQLEVDGTLVATGTAADPVIFTSWFDDSVDGDANGDGPATTPSPGVWDGVEVYRGGVARLDHVQVSYATQGVGTDGGRLELSHSLLAHNRGNAAYAVRTAVDLAALTGNTAVDNGTDGLVLADVTQATSATVTLTGSLAPVLQGYGGCSRPTLTVPAGVTLTLGAGSVVKAFHCAGLTVDGRLVTRGTAANKVYLTSLRDDSVGGDTNTDGTRTGPSAGDWRGVLLGPDGSSRLVATEVRYAG